MSRNTPGLGPGVTPENRDVLLALIQANVIVTDSGCWEWQGYRVDPGYGRMRVDRRQAVVHRISYELHVGPVPAGLLVGHRCDNPPCCNPEHLFPCTHLENSQDAVEKGRITWPPLGVFRANRERTILHNRERREARQLPR